MKLAQRIIASLIAVCMAHAVPAQGTFMKSYLSDTTIDSPGISPTPDGGYVLTGLKDTTVYEKRLCVVKVDSIGALQWSRAFAPVSAFVAPQVITLASGEILVLASEPTSIGQDLLVLRLDAAGDTIWTRVYEHPAPADAMNAVEMSSGDLVLVSYTFETLYLTRITSAGAVVWSNGYSGNLANNSSHADPRAKVILTSDGSIMACGTVPFDTPDGSNGILVKTGLDGGLLWARIIGSNDGDNLRSMVETADGGSMALGYYTLSGTTVMMLIRTDGNGTVLWSKAFNTSDNERAIFMERCPDGNYLIGGDVYNPADGYRGLLLKVTDAGVVIWANAYGSDLLFTSAAMVNDGLAIAAYNFFGGVPVPTMALITGDTIGASSCAIAPFVFNVTNLSLLETSAVQIINGLFSASGSLALSDLLMTETTHCTTAWIADQHHAPNGIILWPNPAQDRLYLDLRASSTSGWIMDATGRTHRTMSLAPGTNEIELGGLHAGAYVLRTAAGVVARFIKE